MRVSELARGLGLVPRDLDSSPGLRQLQLELLNLLRRGLRGRLVGEFGETLPGRDTVETANEQPIKPRLEDGGNRCALAGNEPICPDRNPVGREGRYG
ncbi:MAG: hypothetical protein JOZ58_12365 [Acetobacteraceae bacterium]|nr:hypothetical protein [Acetobacteraceae bacterium]